LLNIFICQHGFGHHKRVLAVVKQMLKMDAASKVTLHTTQKKMEEMLYWSDYKDLQSNPQINWDFTIMSSLPFYQVSGYSGTLSEWEKQNTANLNKIDGPVVIDNDAFLLQYFPTATLMGSFLWSEVIENPENNEFTATEIQCLNKIQPPMLGLADMAMPGVQTRTGFVGLPWFCNRQTNKKKSHVKPSQILVTGGGSEAEQMKLLKTARFLKDKGFVVFADASIHNKSQGEFELFSYAMQAFLSLTAVLCRPGIGVITECVQHSIPVIAIYDPSHPEMAHNAARIEALGIGRAFKGEAIETGLMPVLNELMESDFYPRQAFDRLQCNGEEKAAQWILDNVMYTEN
jgi:hypothetical protein